MVKQTDDAIHFSLLSVLAVTSYIAFTLAVVSYTNSVVYGVHLSLVLVGWVIWRYVHGHLGGIIPALLGGDVLLCSSVAWTIHGSEDLMGFRNIANAFASFLVLAGFAVLVFVGAEKQGFWKHQIGIAALSLCTLVAWWIAIPVLGNAAMAQRRAADIAANSVATAKAIAMVEEARRRIGTAPDKEALQDLLTGPLPSVCWDGNSWQIQYQRTGNTTYRLTYIDPSMFFGDIVVYDSATPQKGWYRIPF